MTDVRELPHMTARVETGPTQFGTDWPGVFIRGDNAFAYANSIRRVLEMVGSKDLGLDYIMLRSIAELLESCIIQ